MIPPRSFGTQPDRNLDNPRGQVHSIDHRLQSFSKHLRWKLAHSFGQKLEQESNRAPGLVGGLPADEADVAEETDGAVALGRVGLVVEAGLGHLRRQRPFVVHVRPVGERVPSRRFAHHRVKRLAKKMRQYIWRYPVRAVFRRWRTTVGARFFWRAHFAGPVNDFISIFCLIDFSFSFTSFGLFAS